MKTRTQRLIDECRRAPMRVREHTVVRILQSLGETHPHWALRNFVNRRVISGGLCITCVLDEHHFATGLWDVQPVEYDLRLAAVRVVGAKRVPGQESLVSR